MARPKQLRIVVAAFGDAGHAFPAIALARELHRRGNEVLIETWEEWEAAVKAEGLPFQAAQEYMVFPPPGPDTPQGQTVAHAARALAELMEGFEPDLVVSDILTLAPTLAAEVAGVRHATLIPHVYPVQAPGQPIYSLGFWPARSAVGRRMWSASMPLIDNGLRQGRDEMNVTRARLGLPPVERFHGGISEALALVGTYPQLEYPRKWPVGTHVTGPLFFELAADPVEVPEGPDPLVVVAPSTAQDRECDLVRAALAGLADEPVRVLATINRREPTEPIEVPANAVLTDWLPYSQVMPQADLVISHGGHGTVVRALHSGAPVLCCPAGGDMGENGARVSWSGAGLSLPRRLVSPRGVRLAARRILSDERFRIRAQEIATWSEANDGAQRASQLVEDTARNESSRLSPAR
ncbi:MAG: glycosyltransferase [Solirubrobacterales bacterium]|nr:glycosyltransferase [Solirubrobacterales bacterium]